MPGGVALLRAARVHLGSRALLALLVALLGVVLLVLSVDRLPPPLGAACSVSAEDTEWRLDGDEARALTDLAAAAERDGVGAAALLPRLRAVHDDADLPLARALLGHGPGRLSCAYPVPGGPVQAEGPAGLTPRAARVLAELEESLGDQSVGGFAPGGVSSGHVPGSAHYDGRAVDVFYRPVSPGQRRRGWVTAQWAVAHAHELRLATVIFDQRIWTAARSDEGWRAYEVPVGGGDPAVRAHLDHVHLDVVRGG